MLKFGFGDKKMLPTRMSGAEKGARLLFYLNECSEQDGNISVSGIQLWYSPQYRCASPCLSLRNPMQTQLSQMGSWHFFFLGVLISRLLPA